MTTNSLINLLLEEHHKCEEIINDNFLSLSKSQLGWKFSAESWSVAECFEHLVRTNREYFPQFKKSIKSLKHLDHDPGFKHTFAGRFILNSVKPSNNRKRKTTKKFNPVYDKKTDPEIIKLYLRQHKSLNGFLNEVRGLDLTKSKNTSPFFKLIKYNLGDSLSIIVYHNFRHIIQAKSIINLPSFPL